MLNAKKIEKAMEERKISKTKLCSSTKIARTTLDAILNGSDAKVSTVETIALHLRVPISYFFDEEHQPKGNEVKTEGDYSPASATGDVSVVMGDAVLAEQVSSLKALVAEKDQRIALLERLAGIAK